MKKKKRILLMLISMLLFFGLLSGCGVFGAGPRNGQGPRRDGSGNGPCSWFSCITDNNRNLQYS